MGRGDQPAQYALPYWLLRFGELIEVLIGNAPERKAEIEILQELIPLAKSRYGSGRGNAARDLRGTSGDTRYTVDTAVPYRRSDLLEVIDERMGKLENKRDLSPYRALQTRLESITLDPRYAFMFGSLTIYDGMAQVLGRMFRAPVNNKPITILELTGLPTEIVNLVVPVQCRMTFDFALWSDGQVPVTTCRPIRVSGSPALTGAGAALALLAPSDLRRHRPPAPAALARAAAALVMVRPTTIRSNR